LRARKARPLLCVLLATPLLLSGCKERNHYEPPPPPQVSVAHPQQKTVSNYLELTGNTVAYNSADLVARVEGFLQEQDYKDGSFVKAGDILFVIEPLPYKAKLDQANSQVAAAQAELKQAEAEYYRQSTLLKTDVASQSKVDQALAKRDSDRANVADAQAGAQLAAINYSYTRVQAPFAGYVTAHLVSVGQLVGSTNPTKLATIVQLDPIYVTFNVNEQDVLRIRAQLRARGLTLADIHKIPVEVGLQTEAGYPHQGVLDYVAPNVDPSSGTLEVRAALANPDRVLLPGYFVRVRVPTGKQPDALLIPETALGTDQGGNYVLVVGKDNVVEQRRVTAGATDNGMRVIESGLTAQDQVVVNGLQRAVPGSKVSPQTATAEGGSPKPGAG
jgi:RND family efflux transporter MFP subunit